MQKVSIGRIVHVRHRDIVSNGSFVAPAIVTRVWNSGAENEMINVTAFPDLGNLKLLGSLSRVEADQHDKDGWFWPPQA